tara:strand:- start:13 stop:237 length:225 start_codon:yes stop_codon:yes gene_type:complete
MNRYEIIKKLGDEFKVLINKGLMSVHLITWLEVYESYLSEMEHNKNKMITYVFVASYYNIDQRQVMRIVKFMST